MRMSLRVGNRAQAIFAHADAPVHARLPHPTVLILMPCGYNLASAKAQAASLFQQPGWTELPAVRNDRVFAVDSGYFSRPGPRVVDGTELLAHLFHPELCDWNGAPDAFEKLQCSACPTPVQPGFEQNQ